MSIFLRMTLVSVYDKMVKINKIKHNTFNIKAMVICSRTCSVKNCGISVDDISMDFVK